MINVWGICFVAGRISHVLKCNYDSILKNVADKGSTTAYYKLFGEENSSLANEIERTQTFSDSDKEIVRTWTWGA